MKLSSFCHRTTYVQLVKLVGLLPLYVTFQSIIRRRRQNGANRVMYQLHRV